MRNATPPEGLTYYSSGPRLPIFDAALWFIVAACIVGLTLLPFGADRRDPYPWGFCAILWGLAAASIFAGVAVLNRRKAVTFNREKGTVIVWTVFFGRRKERRIPLGAFDRVGARAWVQSGRNGRARCYSLDLRGPKQRESLTDFAPANNVEGIRAIAEYLKFPITVEDRDPGQEPLCRL
ncbi:MAG: hypothetical protein JO332_04865 [Planctomycetaceae bacterium]|nr:hypothetical protein [Planctomycetaceae bacterium]